MRKPLSGILDTHAHLSYLDERGIDAAGRVNKLFDNGFRFILDIGTDSDDLAGRISRFAVLDRGEGGVLRFAAGNWPYKDALPLYKEKTAEIERQIEKAPADTVSAVGECGFDRRENPDSPETERSLFEAHLDLARRKKLPLIVHSRDAFKETLDVLRAWPDVLRIIHCFSYGPQEVKAFLDIGCYISFAGNLTFKNASPLREALTLVPQDRLLLETDCPFLAPVPFRGKPCEPGMVTETFSLAASLQAMSVETLAEKVKENAWKVFALRSGAVT